MHHHHHKSKGHGKKFKNVDGALQRSGKHLSWLLFLLRRLNDKLPEQLLTHVLTTEESIQQFQILLPNDSITWLGHAAFLIKLNGKFILTDPFLSNYASPITGLGPKRYVDCVLPMSYFSDLDLLLVSHNHYDHLDAATIETLPNKEAINVMVPLRLGNFFKKRGYLSITELDWHEFSLIEEVKITAAPVVHYSNRHVFDRDRTLWCGFIIESQNKKIFFGGDSAYHSSLFKEIGESYGPFDYAILGIGTYQPRELMRYCHADPSEVLQIAKDLKAKNVIAMHWGTIILSDESVYQPVIEFMDEGAKAGFIEENLWVMKIGESRKL